MIIVRLLAGDAHDIITGTGENLRLKHDILKLQSTPHFYVKLSHSESEIVSPSCIIFSQLIPSHDMMFVCEAK